MSLDLSRWAVIGFKDDTGLGRMSQDFLAMFPEVRFLVTPSVRMLGKELNGTEKPFHPNASEDELWNMLRGLQGIVFFQDPPHPALLRQAASIGIATVAVPMWEWFNAADKDWAHCGHFICPNDFCRRILNRLGICNTSVVPWAVRMSALPQREVVGPARLFVHNAGQFEPDDRKGTRLTIDAFQKVQAPDVRLLVRVQNQLPFPVCDPRIEVVEGNLPFHGDLYAKGDVIIQASKAEGLGFGILEAMASGMPVITTNYPPMNEYVPQRFLKVATKWGKKPAEQNSFIAQAHFKVPRIGALARTIEWCTVNDMGPISTQNRLWANNFLSAEGLRGKWIQIMGKLAK